MKLDYFDQLKDSNLLPCSINVAASILFLILSEFIAFAILYNRFIRAVNGLLTFRSLQ